MGWAGWGFDILVMWELGVASINFRLILYGGTGCGVGVDNPPDHGAVGLSC